MSSFSLDSFLVFREDKNCKPTSRKCGNSCLSKARTPNGCKEKKNSLKQENHKKRQSSIEHQRKHSLPKGVSLKEQSTRVRSVRYYDFKVGKRSVSFNVADSGEGTDSSVSFYIDKSSLRVEPESAKDNLLIALKIKRIMGFDVSTRPDGFRYKNNATVDDGMGKERARIYEKIGFSKPKGGRKGATQYAVVKNGKLSPASEVKVSKKTEADTFKLLDSLLDY
jgi:hypothetical protein